MKKITDKSYIHQQKSTKRRVHNPNQDRQLQMNSINLSINHQSTSRNTFQDAQWTNIHISKRFQDQRQPNYNQINYIQNPQLKIQQIVKKQQKNKSKKKLSLYSNLKNYHCQICENQFFKEDIVKSCSKNHQFCKQCLNRHIQNKIKMNQEVTCPKQDCNSLINENSNFFKSLPQQLLKKYNQIKLNYTILKNQSLKHCPGVNCKGVLKLTELQFCRCGLCNKQYCKLCLLEKHTGACDQAQLNYLQNVLKYRQCFKCKFVVQKIQACNHMTCRCGNQFCYRCGQNWISGHNCQQTISNNSTNNPPIIQNNLTFNRHLTQTNRVPQNRDHENQNKEQIFTSNSRCWKIFKTIIIVIVWIIINFLWISLIGSAVAIVVVISILIILSLGSIAGPFVYLPDLCIKSQCRYILWILTVIFFLIPIAIGILVGIYKIAEKTLPPILQLIESILNVYDKPSNWLCSL